MRDEGAGGRQHTFWVQVVRAKFLGGGTDSVCDDPVLKTLNGREPSLAERAHIGYLEEVCGICGTRVGGGNGMGERARHN